MKFQSTHPHGVRRAAVARIYRPGCVSIHAPSRGATCEDVRNTILVIKFQSTHPHGVRPTPELMPIARTAFQSTHPHGVRHRARIVWFIPFFVSIHAPSRGATLESDAELRDAYVSIHAPSRGATRLIRSSNRDRMAFQSTHPHGVRRTKRIPIKNISLFQSTHPHGVRRCHQSRR